MTDKKIENQRSNERYLIKFYIFIFMYIAVSIFIIYLTFRIGVVDAVKNIIQTKITSVAENVPFPKKVFIIDAGHGGIDSGAVGVDNISEKEINLAISKKLEKLMKTADIEVIMTRTDDIMLSDDNAVRKKASDLANRVRIAKKYPDAVFISIHMNKFTQEKYSGMQVFYSPNNIDSANLADIIKKTNKAYLQSENNREIKRGKDIYVLENIQNTGVLVECGFLSNRNEAYLLCDDAYQNKIAHVIFASVLVYCEEKD